MQNTATLEFEHLPLKLINFLKHHPSENTSTPNQRNCNRFKNISIKISERNESMRQTLCASGVAVSVAAESPDGITSRTELSFSFAKSSIFLEMLAMGNNLFATCCYHMANEESKPCKCRFHRSRRNLQLPNVLPSCGPPLNDELNSAQNTSVSDV